MKKAGIQLLVSVVIIAGLWLALSRIDFLGETTTETITRNTEERLGKLLLKQLDLQYQPSDNDTLVSVIRDIHRKLCKFNDIDPQSIDLHVYHSSTINAAVIPGRNIIIFTGLMEHTGNPDEFAGVLAHEIAHITENHIMERMMAEFGASLLLALSGMDAGSDIIANVLRIITTSAYSREQEREADEKAVEYLLQAEVDPTYLANFLLRISTLEKNGNRIPEWIRTHPDPRERATRIIEKNIDPEMTFRSVYHGNWQSLVDP